MENVRESSKAIEQEAAINPMRIQRDNLLDMHASHGLTNAFMDRRGYALPNLSPALSTTMTLDPASFEYAMNFSNMAALNPNLIPFANVRYATKKDTLRKGKWTHEEEMYTNKIIEAFNAGLLKLPENSCGVTLRSYLADKLGCDPMRITKKYTGASCLGKRVYHKETSSANAEALDKVQEELDHLEAKFRAKMDQMRKEKREHESAIDRMYISSPNIDSIFVPNHMQMNSYGGLHPSTYNLAMNPLYVSSAAKDYSIDESKDVQNYVDRSNSRDSNRSSDEEDESYGKRKESYTPKGFSDGKYNQTFNHVSNLMNPTQLAYIQMLAGCGPYIKTSQSELLPHDIPKKDMYKESHNSSCDTAGTRSERSDTTDEDKNDSVTDSLSVDKTQNYSRFSNSSAAASGTSTGSGSDTSSSENTDEYNFMIQRSSALLEKEKFAINQKPGNSFASLSTMSSSSSNKYNALSPEDDQAASSLITFFNHLNRSNSHQHLVEFAADIQKSVSRSELYPRTMSLGSRVSSAPDLFQLGQKPSNNLKKRRNTEVQLPGNYDTKRLREISNSLSNAK